MNLILLESTDFSSSDRARIDGRRLRHVREVHRANPGDRLRVGLIDGAMGSGVIESLKDDEAWLRVELNEPPPPGLDLTLYLALPRPKFLARVLQAATSMGIKRIYLFNSSRVDKIYWSCEQLTESERRAACLLGLEQARDTILPTIELRRLFKPFVEDELPALVRGTQALVAHPNVADACPFNVAGPVSLAVGPEGGFIPYEIEKLQEAGFLPVRTFDRILKVETALVSLIGRLK